MKLIFSLSERAHGPGRINFAWQNSGNYIATTGYDSQVTINDRHGEIVDDIGLPGACTGLAWDKDGDLLAMTNNKTNIIQLWDVNSRRTTQLDSSMGLKSLTNEDSPDDRRKIDVLSYAGWSRISPVLAVGNSKGNLLLYNHQTARKVPIIGKHTKKITCGAFSDKDLLALGAEDHQITVSNLDGDTVYSFSCTGEPSKLQFAEMKETERTGSGETTISSIVGKQTMMLINLSEPQNPYNLQFQQRYGDLISYAWYGDGYILLGFENGYLVSISTHASEIGQEIFSIQDHKSYLSCVSVSRSFGKAVTAGDSCVKLREISQLNDVYTMVQLDSEDRGLDTVELSSDGQLMAVSGGSGALYVYLTRLPVLADCWITRVAALSSLTEVTVFNETEQERAVVFSVEIEPTFIGVGPVHVVVGMNNRAWFYIVTPHGAELVKDFEYLSSVQTVKVNGYYAAAVLEGRVQLHPIDGSPEDNQSRMFPDQDKSQFKITSAALTNESLIFATDVWGGHLQYFYLEDWKYVNEFRHVMGIKSIHPEPSGTRLCLVDDKWDAFVYNPVNDSLVQMETFGGVLQGVLWDNFPADRDIFVTFDSSTIQTYVYYRDTIEGPKLIHAGQTKLPYGHKPLMLYNGEVTCQTQSGRTNTVQLDTHSFDGNLQGKSEFELTEILNRCLVLKRWPSSWRVCEAKSNRDGWQYLGKAALEHLDIDLAIRVYRHIGDVGMVWSLEEIIGCEDRNLLAGHLAMFLEKFDLAEKLYLESTAPIEALEMRRDLLHWEKALMLANRLSPNQIPLISKEYAQQLEFTGDYSNSLTHYEKGIVDDDKFHDHNEACSGGIARMSIRLGDIRRCFRGVRLAMDSPQRSLKRECAQILENMKQYTEACQVYEKAQFHDRAAAVCVKAKNWMKVGELLPNVHSPKIHAQYAKAMEAEKKFKQAAEAYRNAKDYDNLVRVLLEHLNNPEEAVKVVKESRSVEGANMVAKFFLRLNDFGSAIQFLVISQCHEEAYKLAEEHDNMEIYADVIGNEGTAENYEAMAMYFEKYKKQYLAGKFYHAAGYYTKALSLLLSYGEDHNALALAIDTVGEANDSTLTQKLMDFLMGEIDGIPKDAKYLFRLYMALKMYREAAKTAIIIAREEQNKGQYRIAHDVLFAMYQELRNQSITVPAEMETNLMLIHSYLVVKSLIRRAKNLSGDAKTAEHKKAARMLIRVAENISRFPAHTVQILTSAVIECSKVGLKTSAFNFAAMLMRPEHRKKVDEQYRKKIETIVRKQDKGEEEEAQSPCWYCQTTFKDSELSCSNCKSNIPYCIVTGKHMIKEDFSYCPKCKFPGLYTELKRLFESGEPCTMCGEKVQASETERMTDPSSLLSQLSKSIEIPSI